MPVVMSRMTPPDAAQVLQRGELTALPLHLVADEVRRGIPNTERAERGRR